MKKLILLLTFLLLTTLSNAQCVPKIIDVKQDEIFGSIIVETQYILNGRLIQVGRTRYDETSGTRAEIIAKAKVDIDNHCKQLVARIPENQEFIKNEKLKILSREEGIDVSGKDFSQLESEYLSVMREKELQKIEVRKQATTPIIKDIKPSLVGDRDSVSEATIRFKNKDIKVTHDKKNTVTNNFTPIPR